MFNRKVFFMALLAVFLLGSVMDGQVGVDQYRRRKPRKTAAVGIAAVDPNNYQASLKDKRNRRKPRLSIDPGGLNQAADGIAEMDPNFRRASLTNQMNQVISIAAADPDSYQPSFRDRRKPPRKPRLSIDPGGLNQVAGGILGMDPTI